MGGQIGNIVTDGEIVDSLALRHVLVIQVAHILHALLGQHIYLAALITYQKRLGGLVIVDGGDTRAVQTRAVVIHLDLLRLLIYRKQTAVRQCINALVA